MRVPGILPALLLAFLVACGGPGGAGSSGASTAQPAGPGPGASAAPPTAPGPGASAAPPTAPGRSILGVQSVLVVCVSLPGNPAPFPSSAMLEPMAQANRIIQSNSAGLASLRADFLDLALTGAEDSNLGLLAAVLPHLVQATRHQHLMLVTRGPSASYGSQGLIGGMGVVWQSKPDDDLKWTRNLAPALAHEMGHNWGFAHTATGLMSGAAGDDITFSAEQRHSVGWP